MTKTLCYDVLATPLSSLVVRDGRPFGQGGTMKSLPWIYPSVFTGSLRTALGRELGFDFGDQEKLNELKQVETTGALPCLHGSNLPYLPQPFDCVVCEQGRTRKVYAVRPGELQEGEGVDLPYGDALKPALLQKDEDEDNFKPTQTAPFWSWSRFVDWLKTKNERGTIVEDDKYPQLQESSKVKVCDALNAFPKDERTCVAIDSRRGAASDGQLFSTAGLDLFLKESQESVALFSQITASPKLPTSTLSALGFLAHEAVMSEENKPKLPSSAVSALGGRRRLASWEFEQSTPLKAPEELKKEAENCKRVRMVLATPAIFEGGWLPGWLDSSLTGAPAVCDGKVTLKLESVAIDRWSPVSGWSYEKSAPKRVRRMVPAGGVYFFKVVSGEVDALFDKAWFRSVCDDSQDRRDGFGVALWGVY